MKMILQEVPWFSGWLGIVTFMRSLLHLGPYSSGHNREKRTAVKMVFIYEELKTWSRAWRTEKYLNTKVEANIVQTRRLMWKRVGTVVRAHWGLCLQGFQKLSRCRLLFTSNAIRFSPRARRGYSEDTEKLLVGKVTWSSAEQTCWVQVSTPVWDSTQVSRQTYFKHMILEN